MLHWRHTVDGKNPAPVDSKVVYPIIYKVLYIPGGAGFLPSTVDVVVFCPYTLSETNNKDRT